MQIAVLIALPTVLPSERAALQPAARITCTPPTFGAPPPNFVVVGRVGPVRNGKYLYVPNPFIMKGVAGKNGDSGFMPGPAAVFGIKNV